MTIKHLRTLLDLTPNELENILNRAIELAALRGKKEHPKPLEGKTVVTLFEKASTRTRLSFDVGIQELGGIAVTLLAKDTQLGRGEPIADTAKLLSRMAHAVVYRTFGHERIEALAEHASIPVINGLSDSYHPCQLLADLMTIKENTKKQWKEISVAWIGDGNNMAHSWIYAAKLLGFDLRLACPEGYDPDPKILEQGQLDAPIQLLRDPLAAANEVDVITTDVWASMGQEEEQKIREKVFKNFQVQSKHMKTAQSDAIFLHCLPAHRGEEVSSEVIDGPQSRIWDEAENRLHAQKALLEFAISS